MILYVVLPIILGTLILAGVGGDWVEDNNIKLT